MPSEDRKRSFPPIVDERTRVLVLGSLPGEISLAQSRYYANPRNQFWILMGDVIGVDLVAIAYAERLQALLAAHVGLWDVIESATRAGSLDGNIRSHLPNLLPELVARLPQLRAIAFNGRTSAAIGRLQLGDSQGIELVDLPSSSPAHTMPLALKRLQWMQLGKWLQVPRTSAGP
jgi:hypoxanthine-DNA glycosylase